MAGDPYASIATTAEPGDPYASIATTEGKTDDPYAAIATPVEADPYASISTPAEPKPSFDEQIEKAIGIQGDKTFLPLPAKMPTVGPITVNPLFPPASFPSTKALPRPAAIAEYLDPREWEEAIYEGVAPSISGAATLKNAALLTATAGMGAAKFVAMAVNAYFAGTMAQQFGQQAGELMNLMDDPKSTWKQKVSKIAQAATTGTFTTLAAAGAGSEAKGVLSGLKAPPEAPLKIQPAGDITTVPRLPQTELPAAGAEALQATQDAARAAQKRADVQAALNEVGENQTPQAAEGLAGRLEREERAANTTAQRVAGEEVEPGRPIVPARQRGVLSEPAPLTDADIEAIGKPIPMPPEVAAALAAKASRSVSYQEIYEALSDEHRTALDALAEKVHRGEQLTDTEVATLKAVEDEIARRTANRAASDRGEAPPVSPTAETPPQTEIPAAPTAPAKAEEAQIAPAASAAVEPEIGNTPIPSSPEMAAASAAKASRSVSYRELYQALSKEHQAALDDLAAKVHRGEQLTDAEKATVKAVEDEIARRTAARAASDRGEAPPEEPPAAAAVAVEPPPVKPAPVAGKKVLSDAGLIPDEEMPFNLAGEKGKAPPRGMEEEAANREAAEAEAARQTEFPGTAEEAIPVPAGKTVRDMQRISSRVRALDAELLKPTTRGDYRARLLQERLEVGAEMGHQPSIDALVKHQETVAVQNEHPDINAMVQDVVKKNGITNHADWTWQPEINELATDYGFKDLTGKKTKVTNFGWIGEKGASVGKLAELISSKMGENGLRDRNELHPIGEEQVLSMIKKAFSEGPRPRPEPPVLDLPLVKKPRGPLSDQTGAINPSALLSGPGRSALGAVAGGIYGSTQGNTPEEKAKNAAKYALLFGAGAYAGGKVLEMAGESRTIGQLVEIAKDRGKIADFFAKGQVEKAMAWQRDAASNKANVVGRQQANVIGNALERTFGKDAPLARKALSFMVEAKGDVANLDAMQAKLASAKGTSAEWTKEATDAIAFAKNRAKELLPIAQDYDAITHAQLAAEHASGIDTLERQGYVMHAQDIDDSMGHPFTASAGGGGFTGFKKARGYDTFADSIAGGVDPKSLDAVDLLQSRVAHGQELINRNAWLDGLKQTVDPVSKLPVATNLEVKTHPNGDTYLDAPAGYGVETMGNRPVAVLKGYEGIFSAMTDPSWWSKSAGRRAIQSANAVGKSVNLMIDTFHLGRLAFWEGISKLAGVTTMKLPTPTFEKGVTMLDQTPAEIGRIAKDEGWTPEKTADVLRGQQIVKMGLDTGANFGKISDALHQEIMQKVPIAGTFSKWLFDQYQRGAMAEIYRLEFERQRAMFKDLSDMEVARNVSRDVNTRFGNLGRQGLFKSKTSQDILRMLVLAPQWNEGLVRSEVGAVTQGLGAAADLVRGKQLASGLLFRSVATGLVANFVANQLINQYTRGKFTWQNEEEGIGAKLSAWVPDKIGGGPGFFLNPMGIPAEISHLLMSRFEKTASTRQSLIDFGRSRLSAAMRPVATFILGKTGLGMNIKPDEIWKETAIAAVPTPIPARSAYGAVNEAITGEHSEQFPGQFQKQLMSSFGLKTDQAPAPYQRIGMLARRFNAMNGHEAPGEFYGSDYSDLTHALNLGNAKAVDAALQTLVATKKPQELASYFVHFGDRPFTGNHMTEGRFLETLNPEQKATYEKAVDDRHRLAQAGMKAVEGYFAKTEPEGTGHALAEQAAQKLDIGEGVYSIAQKLKSAAPEDREGMLTQLAAHPAIFKAVANHIRGVTEDLEPSEESIAALGVENGARAKFLKEHITSLPAEDREAFLTRMVEKKLLTGKVLQQIRGE